MKALDLNVLNVVLTLFEVNNDDNRTTLVDFVLVSLVLSTYQVDIYLFKVNNKCERCSKLTVKTPGVKISGVFIVNFEHFSHLFLVFLLLTLNK